MTTGQTTTQGSSLTAMCLTAQHQGEMKQFTKCPKRHPQCSLSYTLQKVNWVQNSFFFHISLAYSFFSLIMSVYAPTADWLQVCFVARSDSLSTA